MEQGPRCPRGEVSFTLQPGEAEEAKEAEQGLMLRTWGFGEELWVPDSSGLGDDPKGSIGEDLAGADGEGCGVLLLHGQCFH